MRQLATLSLLYYFSAWQCALLVVAADADRSSSQSSSSSPSSSRSSSSRSSSSSPSSSSAKNNSSLSAGKLRSLGEIALSERKYSEAESYYRQAIALEPDNGNNYYKLYKVHNRMKSPGDALSDLTEACAREPAKEEWRVQKAKLLAGLGRCEEAAAEYEDFRRHHLAGGGERALDGETEAGQCAQLTQLALQAFSNREFQKSIHYFTSLLSHVNEATDLLFMKAQAEYEVGDYYGVVSDMGKILKSFPKHIEAYQLRGEAYFRLNEMDMAVKHFREGLKLDPEHKGCKEGHKLAKKVQKKEKKADDAFDKGQYNQAIEMWWEAMNIDITRLSFVRPTLLKVVKAHTLLGEHDMAIREAKKHVDNEESIEGLHALGEAQTAAELFDEALRTYQRAMEIAPEDQKRTCKQKVDEAQVALKQSKEKNYYKILGVPRNARLKEIKKSYRDLALKW